MSAERSSMADPNGPRGVSAEPTLGDEQIFVDATGIRARLFGGLGFAMRLLAVCAAAGVLLPLVGLVTGSVSFPQVNASVSTEIGFRGGGNETGAIGVQALTTPGASPKAKRDTVQRSRPVAPPRRPRATVTPAEPRAPQEAIPAAPVAARVSPAPTNEPAPVPTPTAPQGPPVSVAAAIPPPPALPGSEDLGGPDAPPPALR